MNENEVKEVVKAGIKAAARVKSIGKVLAVIGLGATIVGEVAFHARQVGALDDLVAKEENMRRY
ncbi:hypothetical protein PPJ95_08095 [Limosilactobacillus reuteri]|uniref:hypothetical protein n=1 Tax=Limosilactobacillus reuteri TaxID=1598 RepID=UPI0023490758|nr:hypothetical protein [Limosilactobacillus reuteri]MDC6077521.1 hypothetical protein [Limosilactobacillus reuteri]